MKNLNVQLEGCDVNLAVWKILVVAVGGEGDVVDFVDLFSQLGSEAAC